MRKGADEKAEDVVGARRVGIGGDAGLSIRLELPNEVPAATKLVDPHARRDPVDAMVGRQPFGGNRRSGVGAKAGGPDYLRQFCEPRVVSENTVRHGLSFS